MDTVVYSKPFFPRMGGLERNTLTLCQALTELGHEVRLVTETPSDEPDEYSFSVVRTQSVPQFFAELSGAGRLIVNGNISLRMHPLAWIRRVPYATIYHNFRGYERRGTGPMVAVGNKTRGAVARRAWANVFTSTCAKERVGLPASHVVFNPVDKQMEQFYDKEERQGRDSDAPFLFAGRLIQGKGLFVLAEALERLDGELKVRVKVAGEGRDADRFSERVQGLTTVRVELLERLEGPALVEHYQNSRALIVPSTTHKEGNPLVIAEALCAGTPVIASDQPPMIESVGGAGIIVEQGNAQALADAMREMKSNEEAYRRYRERAENRAEVFSYRRYRKRIREIFGTGENKFK